MKGVNDKPKGLPLSTYLLKCYLTIQACRGRKTAHSLVTDASYENNTGIKLMSTHFDVLVSYATVKG